ncbi:hypothetical protein PY479_05780 [Shewanella sp. A32]|uniref:hypothetical protein n=1 Tax=Shewanella sp. A32 TaxID=3031327 RepID=UPI0023B9ABF6|nr:hypothetical protein [Shewanella sp. A32]MDF0533791.1 hypothetical protein [Shewanella sp. A32]
MKNFVFISAATFLLFGCGSMNNALVEKTKTIEYYRIFDIKTDMDRYSIADAASNGLGRNVNDATETRPIPSSAELPEKPGRFALINPFAGSKLAALMAASNGGLGTKVVSCEGAVWVAKAVREIAGQSKLNLDACLFEYKGGYHLDMYAVFTKKEGGLMELSRAAASAMVGTPEEWTEKTFLDVVKQIAKDGHTSISFIEGYPKVEGTPWLDNSDTIVSAP